MAESSCCSEYRTPIVQAPQFPFENEFHVPSNGCLGVTRLKAGSSSVNANSPWIIQAGFCKRAALPVARAIFCSQVCTNVDIIPNRPQNQDICGRIEV